MSKVALFGLGRVGAGYPRIDGCARNHLDAILDSREIELVAAIDSNVEQARAVAKRLPLIAHRVFSSLNEADAGRIDIAVVATPSQIRLGPILEALEAGVKILIVEKPLALTFDEACTIAREAQAHNADLRVNFHRRYDPAVQALKKTRRGEFIGAQARYSNGIFNYGSHLIDLLSEWCGPVVQVRALDNLQEHDSDPTLSFQLEFANAKTCLVLGMHNAGYDVFDVDLMFDDCRIEMSAGGAWRRVWTPCEDLYYPGYRHLFPQSHDKVAGALTGLSEIYASIERSLRGGIEFPGCDADTALSGIAVIEAIVASARMSNSRVAVARA